MQIPYAVRDAQQLGSDSMKKEERTHKSEVNLFFSFDIVNSTMYKSATGNWPIIIKSLLERIRAKVSRTECLVSSFLWRVIGDETVFVLRISSQKELYSAIDDIFEVTQGIANSLKSGKFFETIEDQSLRDTEIEILKSQNTLSIKSAAWIAAINDNLTSPYDNITFNYSTSTQNTSIKEFLGKDIDAGFRLKEYTQDRRLAISFELACFLSEPQKQHNLHIMDYVKLKGVWNNALYPVIWYYNDKLAKNYQVEPSDKSKTIPFNDSFRYDEADNNPMVRNYFIRNSNQSEDITVIQSDNAELNTKMYTDIKYALDKIKKDRNLTPKIQYIDSLFSDEILLSSDSPYVSPLEMHCAVVCCDVNSRKVLITHRSMEHSTNPCKWEFGCAKATSEEPLVKTICDYYKKHFGIDIELVMDKARSEQQPVPIAVYEVNNSSNIKKGIIFIAKVVNKQQYRSAIDHDNIKWISESDIDNYVGNDAVNDFHNTLKKVFDNFDAYFNQEI